MTESHPEPGAVTHRFAGVPVSDLDASIDWYTCFFGRPPDRRVGEEILWEVDDHAWLFIEPKAARAGAGRITFAVTGLEALLERLAIQRMEHEAIETYSNGVRHVKVPDPDGNAIAFAEPPDAASASPRSAGRGACVMGGQGGESGQALSPGRLSGGELQPVVARPSRRSLRFGRQRCCDDKQERERSLDELRIMGCWRSKQKVLWRFQSPYRAWVGRWTKAPSSNG